MTQRKALVIGLGKSGRAAALFLKASGADVTGVDAKLTNDMDCLREKGVILKQETELASVSPFDLVIVSPGLPPSHFLYQEASDRGIETIGEFELALRDLEVPCIAVTGTNGKTTATMLLEHLLNKAGKRSKALGNVGTPLICWRDFKPEIVVAEVSSFQLETAHTRALVGGVLLNITPDHLDRYSTFQEYAKAKFKMADCLKEGKSFFVSPAVNVDYHTHFPSFDESLHPDQNVCAALALYKTLGLDENLFWEGLKSFRSPPHRIEFVRQWKGISFYNDSKATNVDSVLRAVRILQGPIILIAGGRHKGAPYTSWLPHFCGKVRHIFTIGEAAPLIEQDLGQTIPISYSVDLEHALSAAAAFAKEGDNVLLSPGCASYDQFKDYAHRGEQFKLLVNSL